MSGQVRSVGGEPALKFLGARLAGPDRRQGGWQYIKGFPPAKPALGPITEVAGAVILPPAQPRPLLGYEVVREDVPAMRSEVVVTYAVDGNTYEWRSPAQLVYCPDGMDSDSCRDATS